MNDHPFGVDELAAWQAQQQQPAGCSTDAVAAILLLAGMLAGYLAFGLMRPRIDANDPASHRQPVHRAEPLEGRGDRVQVRQGAEAISAVRRVRQSDPK